MKDDYPVIECEIEVPAPVEAVWDAWTTVAGAKTFFAPQARIDPKPGGRYEILFNPSAKPGDQGAEGMRVLAMQKPGFLSFTWNAPPQLADVRGQMTVVEIRMTESAESTTRVHLRHGAWGTGGQWQDALTYFSTAWPKIVLPRLRHSFLEGPVDWTNPPRFD